MIPKVSVGPIPKVTVEPLPSILPKPPIVGNNNPSKVSAKALNNVTRKYYGTMTQYLGWRVIEETLLPGGRCDLMVTKGKRVAMIYSARRSSVIHL